MRIRQAYYLCLTLSLLFGLVAGGFLTTAMAANQAQPSLIGPGTGPSGTLTGCLGTASPAARLSLGGRVITPSTLLEISPTGLCGAAEENINLFSYANTVLISAGSDQVANGTSLLAALSAVSALSPSATKPFLLKLEPGVYDLGANSLSMLPFVEIEGSGEKATKITAAGQASATTGVIAGSNNTEVRYLSVESRAGNSNSTGIYAGSGVNNGFKISHVTVLVGGGSANGTGISNDFNSSNTLIENVTIQVSNSTGAGESSGIANNGTTTQILNSQIKVQSSGTGRTRGIYNFNGSNVVIKNNSVSVSTTGSSDTIAIENNSSATSLIQSTNLTTATSGGGNAFGISADTLAVSTIQNVKLTVTTIGGSGNNGAQGLYLGNQANVTVEDSNITVSTNGSPFAQGAINNTTGVNTAASLTIRGSTFSVSAVNKANCQAFGFNTFGGLISAYNSSVTSTVGANCYAGTGLVLQGTPNVINFNNGYVKGSHYAISNGTGNPIRVGASQLDAPTIVAGVSPALCMSSFRGDYSATNANCT